MGVFASPPNWSGPNSTLGLPWISFGRIRPIHTNLVIFAFGGGALFATSFYVGAAHQLGPADLRHALPVFVFWGWQAAIVAMVVSYPLGYTTSKEYAEMEWPIALWVTIRLGRLRLPVLRHHRCGARSRHIYVGNWFYGAFIVVTAMVHIVNHLASAGDATEVLPARTPALPMR